LLNEGLKMKTVSTDEYGDTISSGSTGSTTCADLLCNTISAAHHGICHICNFTVWNDVSRCKVRYEAYGVDVDYNSSAGPLLRWYPDTGPI
jgi:hypothetical protein